MTRFPDLTASVILEEAEYFRYQQRPRQERREQNRWRTRHLVKGCRVYFDDHIDLRFWLAFRGYVDVDSIHGQGPLDGADDMCVPWRMSPTPALDAALERDAERWFLTHQRCRSWKVLVTSLMIYYECQQCDDQIGILVEGRT